MAKSTRALVTKLYPIVESKMPSKLNAFRGCVSRFMEKRNPYLYDTCPADRIYYGEEDAKDLFAALDIKEAEIESIIKETYYAAMSNFNPRAAKDPVTVLMMMIIRHFYIKKMQKELELACLYLAFSGKFYPSIHYAFFPKVQPCEYRHVIEYVVNSMLTNKFDLKTKGSVIGAIKSVTLTWLDTYENMFKSSDDEDVTYLIQQLHNRIKSFMKNIADLYYDAYNNKDTYISYDSDSLDPNSYRLADNDSLKAGRASEKALEKILSSSVQYNICKMASDTNIRTEELKGIIESITNSKDYSSEVKELVSLLIVTYFEQSKTKDVRDIAFITFSITPKPNTKDKNILRIKEIVEDWLNENSMAYRRRKSRLATKNSYNRAVLLYYTLMIHNANK